MALLCAVLVFGLSWVAASPTHHHALHGRADLAADTAHNCDSHGGAPADGCTDPGCVVNAFLAGATDLGWPVLLFLLFILACRPGELVELTTLPVRALLARHAPTCGPPQA